MVAAPEHFPKLTPAEYLDIEIKPMYLTFCNGFQHGFIKLYFR